MRKLTAYTIAKNCTDINDCEAGITELQLFFKGRVNIPDSAFIRYYKLRIKLKKLTDEKS
ncbi:MAG: hypothetical protein V4549_03315 [Bacteroidota bacterium]